ncbi:hypothetical protein ACFL0M_15745, partial [Thermodesulfobacteriota bacterium]
MNRKIVFAFAPIFFFLLSFPNVQGAMVRLSLEQLVEDADLVIIGIVEGVVSELIMGKIFSFATISINSKIKGESGHTPDEIIVRFPGGTVGDIAVKVEDSPDYKQGEKVLIFLKKIPKQPYYRTLGASQGRFLIKDH